MSEYLEGFVPLREAVALYRRLKYDDRSKATEVTTQEKFIRDAYRRNETLRRMGRNDATSTIDPPPTEESIEEIDEKLLARVELDTQAWREIRSSLLLSKLPSFGVAKYLGVVEIPAASWSAVEDAAPPNLVRCYNGASLEAAPLIKEGHVEELVQSGFVARDNPFSLSAALALGPMPQLTTPVPSTAPAPTVKSKGGASPDYEKMKGFLTAACHVLFNEKKLAASEKEFRKVVVDRMDKLGLPPVSEPTARTFMRDLWQAINQDE